MQKKYFKYIYFSIFLIVVSCRSNFDYDDYRAYFGGEIENPKSRNVILLRNEKPIDTFKLDNNNRFFHHFDSLTPGLYTFRSDPEYQYVYFDKNDSLMIQLNSNDFDKTLVFCGRGYEKNNVLMDLYLKNEDIKNNLFTQYDKDLYKFIKTVDSSYYYVRKFYHSKKDLINWTSNFDKYAKATIDLNQAYIKELYPIAHEFRTGVKVNKLLPKSYYVHRRKINVNDPQLAYFAPFLKYTTVMLNNMIVCNGKGCSEMNTLNENINKIRIADTLFKNQEVKNLVLNNVAHMYLLSDQSANNNAKFFSEYSKIATDKELNESVIKTSKQIKKLSPNNNLPKIKLVDHYEKPIDITKGFSKKTVLYFWSKHSMVHSEEVHKKADELKKIYPDILFISINIDGNKDEWYKSLNQINVNNFENEWLAQDFYDIKEKWVINKIYRTIILNKDGTINNAFVNIMEKDFEKKLKQ